MLVDKTTFYILDTATGLSQTEATHFLNNPAPVLERGKGLIIKAT